MASKPILSAVPATPEERSVDRRICEPDGTAALWEAFWSSVEIGVRNALVRACQPLVRVMVMRLPANVRAYWEKDDLQSFGQLGLMEAIDRWAPDSPLDGLGAYATKWVRGSVYDELGRLEWLPRAVRRTIVDYHDRVDSLANDLRKTHASEHLLAEIGVVKRAKGEIPSLRSSQLLHLERAVGSTSSAEQARRLIDLVVDGDHVGPGTQVLAYVESEAVRLAITRLPERQRMIVTCHFLGGLTQEQIGLMLGVSNSRVGQIEASAMQTLWSVLGASRETTKLQAG